MIIFVGAGRKRVNFGCVIIVYLHIRLAIICICLSDLLGGDFFAESGNMWG